MKALKRDLQSIMKGLKTLTQKTESMAKKLEKLEAPKPKRVSKPKVAAKPKAAKAKAAKAKAVPKPKAAKAKVTKKVAEKKPKKVSASDTILAIIKRSKKGVNTAALKKKTGFKDNNIRAIIYRLRKQNKIKSEQKGIYVKA